MSVAVIESRLPGRPNTNKFFIPLKGGGGAEGPYRDNLAFSLRNKGYQVRLEFEVDPDRGASRCIDILARQARELLVIEVKARNAEYGVGQVLVYTSRIREFLVDGRIEDCEPPIPVLAAPRSAWTNALWNVCQDVGIRSWVLGA